MIRSVRLINFKSHKDTTIELSDGLTCIIGSGNVGKSAFVSGMRWVLQNEVSKDFITWGENKSTVTLTFDTGIEVQRGRDGKKNFYKITFPDGEEKLFENFGIEIPKEVEDVLSNVYLPIDVDKKINLNMIRQHDGLFLLNESGSIRNKAINAVIGMQYIDSAIRGLAPEIKTAESSKKQIEVEIDELTKKVEELGDIQRFERTVGEAKQLYQSIEETEKKKEELEHIISLSNDIAERLEYVRYRQSKCPNKDDIDRLDVLVDKYKTIVSLMNVVVEFNVRHETFNDKKKQYDYVDTNLIGMFNELVNSYEKIVPVYNSVVSFEERYSKFNTKKKEYEGIDEGLILEFEEKVKDYGKLFALNNVLVDFKERYDRFVWKKKQFGEINTENIEKYFKLVDTYNTLSDLTNKSDDINRRYDDLKEREEYLGMEISVSRSDLVASVKEMHRCPVCESEIDDSRAEIIVDRS